MVEHDFLGDFRNQRYAKWNSGLGQAILEGGHSLATLTALASERGLAPRPVSGRQEMIEARVNQALFG